MSASDAESQAPVAKYEGQQGPRKVLSVFFRAKKSKIKKSLECTLASCKVALFKFKVKEHVQPLVAQSAAEGDRIP